MGTLDAPNDTVLGLDATPICCGIVRRAADIDLSVSRDDGTHAREGL